jgi:HD-GYP domain-containing protein (c-di-GMP phosphodiesterase class II)
MGGAGTRDTGRERLSDGGVPQDGTLAPPSQPSPVLPPNGTFIERFMNLAGTLAGPASPAGVAEALGSAALALAAGGACAVYLRAEGSAPERLWASSREVPALPTPPGSEPLIVEDIAELPADDESRLAAERGACRAFASWPLIAGAGPVGSLVCWFAAPRRWPAAELDVMSALALQGGAALGQAAGADAADTGAGDSRIADALRLLETGGKQLADAHRALQAEYARLVQTRRGLGALTVWLLALQNEVRTERARLAEEQARLAQARADLASGSARVAAVREALDARISAARQELENESARLADMRRGLFERKDPADAREQAAGDRALLSDARRILEEEGARLMQVLRTGGAPTETAPVAPSPPAGPAPAAAPADRSISSEPEAHAPGAPVNGADSEQPALPGNAYELGGPLPPPRTFEELYPLLVERAAKLLNQPQAAALEEQLKILGRVLDDRDGHRAGYSERLAAWAEATAGILGCSHDEIADIRRAALLHDLGKIGVPETILRAAARLTEQERRIVRSVPTLAEQVARPVEGLKGAAAVLRHRYEQWDGKGYPDGLKGDRIPVGARILAVVDAYGVMTTVRPYRPMVYSRDAVAELRRCAGAQFDPNVVEAFCSVLKREG